MKQWGIQNPWEGGCIHAAGAWWITNTSPCPQPGPTSVGLSKSGAVLSTLFAHILYSLIHPFIHELP